MFDEHAGVENASVAGEQTTEVNSVDVENDVENADYSLFNERESAGVEEPAAAGQETEVEESRIERAFAKRLSQEREKLRRELEEELMQKLQPAIQQPQVNIEEQAQKLAEEWMVTPEVAKAFLLQEERMKNLTAKLFLTEDNIAKAEAKAKIESRRASNPHLPPFDEKKLLDIRLKQYKQYGVMPGWEEAYKIYAGESLLSGEANRLIEQKVISQISGRDRASLQVGRASSPKKRDFWDYSNEEFEALKEKAKRGELKSI